MKCKSTGILIGIAFFLSCFGNNLKAQEKEISAYFPEIEILASNNPAEGYFFMGSKGLTAPNASHYITIIDNYGTPVFFRKMNKATSSIRLLNDGRIAYLNGVPRKIYILNDKLEVENLIAIEGFQPNGHDWDVAENGNILLMGEAKSTIDMSQLVDGGNPEAEVLDLIIQEFDTELNLIYTWNSADHFNILDGNENSQYLDFTENQIDYVHANGLSVDSDTSFLISCRHMDEITKVDRRNGEIIWRLGGKKNQFLFVNDDLRFTHQHSIRALENGHILLYDNGNLHNPQMSSSVEYAIDERSKTATLVNRFYRNPVVYSNHQGTTQRIDNGNTLINWGPYWPSISEFHPDGSLALDWDFTKHSFSPRVEKYKWETKVFETNSSNLEFDIWEGDSLTQKVWIKNNTSDSLLITTLETRTSSFGIINKLPFKIASNDSVELVVWYHPVDVETGFIKDVLTVASDDTNQRVARQIKVSGRKQDNNSPTAKLVMPNEEVLLNAQIKILFNEAVTAGITRELIYNNIDSFIVFKKQNRYGENVTFNAVISSDKKEITIIPETKLQELTLYYIALKSGITDYSENPLLNFEDSFTTVLTSSSILHRNEEIKIFPNPTSQKLNLEFKSHEGDLIYEIYSSTGILLEKRKLTVASGINEIDVQKLETGIYFLVLDFENRKETRKFVKL